MREVIMKTARFIKTFATVAAGTVLLTNAFAQSAKEVVGATPYVGIESETPPNYPAAPAVVNEFRPASRTGRNSRLSVEFVGGQAS
jgi:hypothetical protein